jgi:hypothetical protein
MRLRERSSWPFVVVAPDALERPAPPELVGEPLALGLVFVFS